MLESVNRSKHDKPFIVYSNDGKIWDSESKTFKGTDEGNLILHKLLPNWFELGVEYIGGCCNIGSKDLIHFNEIIEKFV